MSRDYRKEHDLACKELEFAKEVAKKSFGIDSDTILFKKINRNGDIRVGYKDFSSDENFKLIPISEVKRRNISIDILPEYTDFSRKYQQLRHALNQFLSETRFQSRKALGDAKEGYLRPFYEKRREIYDAYMSSEEWQSKRESCFIFHGTVCVDCKAVKATDIHHRHYETLGCEDPAKDIVPLCSECHKKRHDANSLMDKPIESLAVSSTLSVYVNQEVISPLFGRGTVRSIYKSGDYNAARISFGTEVKVLILEYANLEIFDPYMAARS